MYRYVRSFGAGRSRILLSELTSNFFQILLTEILFVSRILMGVMGGHIYSTMSNSVWIMQTIKLNLNNTLEPIIWKTMSLNGMFLGQVLVE